MNHDQTRHQHSPPGMDPPGVPAGSIATGEGTEPSHRPQADEAPHSKPPRDGAVLIGRGNRRKSLFSIGTYNVTTLETPFATEQLDEALKDYHHDIIALAETHTIGTDERLGGRLLLCGGEARYAGVGILMSKRAAKAVSQTWYLNERMMAARFTLPAGRTLLFVAVYAPTAQAPLTTIDAFYEELSTFVQANKARHREYLVVAGDWNAKLGSDRATDPTVLGPHGFGALNERGERLINFCCTNALTAAHSWFPKRPVQKVTWVSRAGNARNAIDHVLVDKELSPTLKDCRSFNTGFETDHRLVLCLLRLHCKGNYIQPTHADRPPSTNSLNNAAANLQFPSSVAARITEDDTLETITAAIVDEATRLATEAPAALKPKKPHISKGTLELIRLKHAARHKPEYKELSKKVRQASNADLQAWLNEQADAINTAFHNNDSRALFRLTKNLTPHSKRKPAQIKNAAGLALTSTEAEIERWLEYAQQLFKSELHYDPPSPPNRDDTSEPSREEVWSATCTLKNGKAPGPDAATAELIKAATKHPDVLTALHGAVLKIWRSGVWPKSATTSTYVALYKKGDAGVCANYRTLALISHASKVVINLLLKELNKVAEAMVSENQFGFMRGKSTTDAIFKLKLIGQAYMASHTPLHCVFIDFKKAFDSVNHQQLFHSLRETNIHPTVLTLVVHLYSNAAGTLRWKGQHTASFRTPAGVRQGCPLSPVLFNIYTEVIMRRFTQRISHLPSPDVEGLHNAELRYADDIVLLAKTAADAEEMLIILAETAAAAGLVVHPDKTEYMIMEPRPLAPDATISYAGKPLKRTSSFRYLGCLIHADLNDSTEIRSRIAIGRKALDSRYVKSKRININTKIQLARALIMSKVLYASPSWTIKAADAVKLDVFGRDIWRGLLGLSANSLKDNFVKNAELSNIINNRWHFSRDTVLHHHASWLGHFARHTDNALAYLTGSPETCRRPPGRPYTRWIDSLAKWSGHLPNQLVQLAAARVPLTQQPLRRSARLNGHENGSG